MRYTLAALAVVLYIVAAASPVSAGEAGEAGELVVAMAESPPWRMMQNGEAVGVDVDILRDAAARIGYSLRFKLGTFRQCIKRIQRGKADVMAGLVRRPKREKFLVYVMPPYITGTTSVFYASRRLAPIIKRYEFLRPLRIGVKKGERHFPQFDHDRELRKTWTRGVADGFQRLASGRVGAVVAEEYQADWWLAAHPDIAAVVAKAPLKYKTYEPLYFVFSAKSSHVDKAPALGEALASMIRDGALDHYLEKYALH